MTPQGTPSVLPEDGLSTRERRNQPLLIVNTGDGKGKSTAAFGLSLRAWNQGWNIGVFQFVKSAKWRIGEQTVLERLGELHQQTGEGGPVEWPNDPSRHAICPPRGRTEHPGAAQPTAADREHR